MIFPYTIDPVHHVVIVTLCGTVLGSDIARTMETLYRDPAWAFGLDSVWDGTHITQLLFERDDMAGFIALEQQYADVVGKGRVVLVVTRPLDEMMARMYATMSKKMARSVHVCQSLSAACEILRPGRGVRRSTIT